MAVSPIYLVANLAALNRTNHYFKCTKTMAMARPDNLPVRVRHSRQHDRETRSGDRVRAALDRSHSASVRG